ncbi:MAG: polysaccharide pyruvyl transferase family protein [Elainellaceae cyanobacterium]
MLAIHGAYYDNNFGDLLLIKIFENWAKSAANLPVVYPLVPKKEQPRYDKFFPDSHYGIDRPKDWHALIYSGGGHFGEPDQSSRKGYKGYRSWGLRFFLRHVLPAELCIRNQVPYAIAGVGVGPLSNLMVRREVRRIFDHADLISVRDEESHEFVQKQLGIQDVHLVPDAALTVSKDDLPAAALDTATQVLGDYGDRPLFGIHHPRYILAETPQAEALRASLIVALAAASDMVPVVFADDGNSKYSEPCERLAELIRNSTGKPCLAIPFKGVWETVALISKFSAVMTTKLHVSILAYAMGIYCESFAVHPKVARFYRQIGRSHQCTLLRDIDKIVAAKKMERVIAAIDHPDVIQDDHWAAIREQARLNQILMTRFLDAALTVRNVA